MYIYFEIKALLYIQNINKKQYDIIINNSIIKNKIYM